MASTRQPVSFIACAAPDQALPFYRDVFGLTLIEQSPYALVFMDGDHMLRVQIVADAQPVGYTVHGWQVANIAAEIESLKAKGVVFRQFDHLEQDNLGIWTTPDCNKIAWFKDPCGNTLSLTEFA